MDAAVDERTDADLLGAFATSRAEAAFRDLVARHGPMVLGVCRRRLGDAHAAEDAFQATFLILARRAADAPRRALGAWLFGVARRVAMKAQVAARRRAAREQRAAEMRRHDAPAADALGGATDDLKRVIDEEVERLPAPLRTAVVLCDLGGLTRRQAADQIGCPDSTLSSRLAQARALLARRLAGRGISPTLAGLAVAVPAALLDRTAAAAAGSAATSPTALALADEALAPAWVSQLVAGLVVAFAGTLGLVMGVSADPVVPESRVVPPAPTDRAWVDHFDGRFALDWRPLRPDPTHVSLDRYPGQLTITTQRGTMYGLTGALRPRNVYLIDNPLPPGADFTLTTRLIGFRPVAAYQQAGLVLYDGDDDYLKYVYEYEWMLRGVVPAEAVQAAAGTPATATQVGGECFAFVHEAGGRAWNNHAAAPRGVGAVWLRVVHRGGRYSFAFSTDGVRFTPHGTTTWPGAPRRVGLIAKNGGLDGVPETDARFDIFELRTP